MRHHIHIICILILSVPYIAIAQDGEDIFRRNCAVCHRIGQGRLVGPDLLNMHKNRDSIWLVDFIRSSQTMIKEGDEDAVNIFREYNNLIMPDFTHLGNEDITSLLLYIESFAGQVTDVEKPVSSESFSNGIKNEFASVKEKYKQSAELFDKVIVIIMFFFTILLAILVLLMVRNN